MKLTLLLVGLLASASAFAQTQHFINWSMDTTPTEATITVAPGDIVNWFWMDFQPHSVTSGPNSSENFDSGVQAVGNDPVVFSHTFTEIGENPYFCTMHPAMTGVITVASTAGIKDDKAQQVLSYPNPVSDTFTIESTEIFTGISLYDSAGKIIFSSSGGTAKTVIHMSGMSSGIYILNATTKSGTKTIKLVKL